MPHRFANCRYLTSQMLDGDLRRSGDSSSKPILWRIKGCVWWFNRGDNNSNNNNLEMPHEWVNRHKNATNGWCLEAFLQPSVIQAAEQMMERRGSVKSAWTKTGCRGINLQNKTHLAQKLDKQVWGIAYNDIIKILLKKYCRYNCIFLTLILYFLSCFDFICL